MYLNIHYTGNFIFSLFFGILTVLFWIVAYILIVASGFKSISTKKVAMPYLASILNFSWEFCALLFWRYPCLWGFIICFLIDLLIVYFGFRFLPNLKRKIFYLAAILLGIACFFFLFQVDRAFIYSAYTIDLIMVLCFLFQRKQLSLVYKVPIASAKLIGSFFAGFVFYHDYPFSAIIALLVTIGNSIYLYQCIKERAADLNN